jgi:RNA polymerase sigma factor (sigma-70 family)
MYAGPSTNASLVLRLRDPRDEGAWCEFVQIYEPMIFNLVRRKGFQEADAAEITQDVLLAVMRAVKNWNPGSEHGSFRGWLFTISRRLIINFLSSPARRIAGSGRTSLLERLLEQPARSEADSAFFDLELKRRLFEWAAARVKHRVAPATWEAFWRTAVQEMPPKAVARDLGMRLGAVYLARCRVMHQLRKVVEQKLRNSDLDEACDD